MKPAIILTGSNANEFNNILAEGSYYTTSISTGIKQYAYGDSTIYTKNDTITVKNIPKIDISKASISGIKNQTYTGKKITQSIKVKLDGNK